MFKHLAPLLLLFSLMACGGPESGEVYSKDYLPESIAYRTVQDYQLQPYYDPNLKMWTTRQVWIGSHEEPYTEAECYEIRFRDDDGNTGADCVGKTRWDSLSIGTWYTR